MKRLLSLFLAVAVCLPSYGTYIFPGSSGGSNSLTNPTVSGDMNFYSSQFIISDGGDRTVFKGDVFEFKNAAGNRNCIYIHTPNVNPQFTVTGCDIWFETTDGGGAAGSLASLSQNVDIGISTYQQGDLPGMHPFRHLAMSGTQIFIPWSERTNHTLSSMASVMKHTQVGTVAGGNQGIQTTNINSWTWSNSGSGRYIEHYLGGSGLFFTQQNVDFELNYESGKGRLIIADSNAGSDGDRGETVVLVGGTKAVTNTSVTAKTVVNCSRSAFGGDVGHIEAVINAGVGYTVNSSSATDTSTLKCLLWENGRP